MALANDDSFQLNSERCFDALLATGLLLVYRTYKAMLPAASIDQMTVTVDSFCRSPKWKKLRKKGPKLGPTDYFLYLQESWLETTGLIKFNEAF